MKKAVLSVVAALVVIVAAVAFKNIYSCNIPIGNRGIRDAISQGELNVLFVGSSTFRSDFDVKLLDEQYDNRAYILSYGGNQYVATAIQYDEIKNRATENIDTIIFELDPLGLTEEVKLSDSRVIWDLSMEGKLRLWEKMSAVNDDFSLMYEYFVTSGMDDLITYPVTERFYATRYYKGAKTDDTQSPGKEYLDNEEYDISGLELVEAQRDAVLEIIDKCKADNQKYIFLECPHYYRLQNDPVYTEYLEYIRKLLDDNDVEYITAEDVEFDNTNPDYFEDMSHMSAVGRQKYTEALIDTLNK